MNSSKKITARLRTEPTEELPRLLRLYRNTPAAKLVEQEIKRRKTLTNS